MVFEQTSNSTQNMSYNVEKIYKLYASRQTNQKASKSRQSNQNIPHQRAISVTEKPHGHFDNTQQIGFSGHNMMMNNPNDGHQFGNNMIIQDAVIGNQITRNDHNQKVQLNQQIDLLQNHGYSTNPVGARSTVQSQNKQARPQIKKSRSKQNFERLIAYLVQIPN